MQISLLSPKILIFVLAFSLLSPISPVSQIFSSFCYAEDKKPSTNEGAQATDDKSSYLQQRAIELLGEKLQDDAKKEGKKVPTKEEAEKKAKEKFEEDKKLQKEYIEEASREIAGVGEVEGVASGEESPQGYNPETGEPLQQSPTNPSDTFGADTTGESPQTNEPPPPPDEPKYTWGEATSETEASQFASEMDDLSPDTSSTGDGLTEPVATEPPSEPSSSSEQKQEENESWTNWAKDQLGLKSPEGVIKDSREQLPYGSKELEKQFVGDYKEGSAKASVPEKVMTGAADALEKVGTNLPDALQKTANGTWDALAKADQAAGSPVKMWSDGASEIWNEGLTPTLEETTPFTDFQNKLGQGTQWLEKKRLDTVQWLNTPAAGESEPGALASSASAVLTLIPKAGELALGEVGSAFNAVGAVCATPAQINEMGFSEGLKMTGDNLWNATKAFFYDNPKNFINTLVQESQPTLDPQYVQQSIAQADALGKGLIPGLTTATALLENADVPYSAMSADALGAAAAYGLPAAVGIGKDLGLPATRAAATIAKTEAAAAENALPGNVTAIVNPEKPSQYTLAYEPETIAKMAPGESMPFKVLDTSGKETGLTGQVVRNAEGRLDVLPDTPPSKNSFSTPDMIDLTKGSNGEWSQVKSASADYQVPREQALAPYKPAASFEDAAAGWKRVAATEEPVAATPASTVGRKIYTPSENLPAIRQPATAETPSPAYTSPRTPDVPTQITQAIRATQEPIASVPKVASTGGENIVSFKPSDVSGTSSGKPSYSGRDILTQREPTSPAAVTDLNAYRATKTLPPKTPTPTSVQPIPQKIPMQKVANSDTSSPQTRAISPAIAKKPPLTRNLEAADSTPPTVRDQIGGKPLENSEMTPSTTQPAKVSPLTVEKISTADAIKNNTPGNMVGGTTKDNWATMKELASSDKATIGRTPTREISDAVPAVTDQASPKAFSKSKTSESTSLPTRESAFKQTLDTLFEKNLLPQNPIPESQTLFPKLGRILEKFDGFFDESARRNDILKNIHDHVWKEIGSQIESSIHEAMYEGQLDGLRTRCEQSLIQNADSIAQGAMDSLGLKISPEKSFWKNPRKISPENAAALKRGIVRGIQQGTPDGVARGPLENYQYIPQRDPLESAVRWVVARDTYRQLDYAQRVSKDLDKQAFWAAKEGNPILMQSALDKLKATIKNHFDIDFITDGQGNSRKVSPQMTLPSLKDSLISAAQVWKALEPFYDYPRFFENRVRKIFVYNKVMVRKKEIGGLYDDINKKIELSIRSDDFIDTVRHELAHSYDIPLESPIQERRYWTKDDIHKQIPGLNALNLNKNGFVTDYSLTNCREDFATHAQLQYDPYALWPRVDSSPIMKAKATSFADHVTDLLDKNNQNILFDEARFALDAWVNEQLPLTLEQIDSYIRFVKEQSPNNAYWLDYSLQRSIYKQAENILKNWVNGKTNLNLDEFDSYIHRWENAMEWLDKHIPDYAKDPRTSHSTETLRSKIEKKFISTWPEAKLEDHFNVVGGKPSDTIAHEKPIVQLAAQKDLIEEAASQSPLRTETISATDVIKNNPPGNMVGGTTKDNWPTMKELAKDDKSVAKTPKQQAGDAIMAAAKDAPIAERPARVTDSEVANVGGLAAEHRPTIASLAEKSDSIPDLHEPTVMIRENGRLSRILPNDSRYAQALKNPKAVIRTHPPQTHLDEILASINVANKHGDGTYLVANSTRGPIPQRILDGLEKDVPIYNVDIPALLPAESEGVLSSQTAQRAPEITIDHHGKNAKKGTYEGNRVFDAKNHPFTGEPLKVEALEKSAHSVDLASASLAWEKYGPEIVANKTVEFRKHANPEYRKIASEYHSTTTNNVKIVRMLDETMKAPLGADGHGGLFDQYMQVLFSANKTPANIDFIHRLPWDALSDMPLPQEKNLSSMSPAKIMELNRKGSAKTLNIVNQVWDDMTIRAMDAVNKDKLIPDFAKSAKLLDQLTEPRRNETQFIREINTPLDQIPSERQSVALAGKKYLMETHLTPATGMESSILSLKPDQIAFKYPMVAEVIKNNPEQIQPILEQILIVKDGMGFDGMDWSRTAAGATDALAILSPNGNLIDTRLLNGLKFSDNFPKGATKDGAFFHSEKREFAAIPNKIDAILAVLQAILERK